MYIYIYIALHCITLHCIALRYITLRYIYITFTLHLHYIYITFTLHLHYIYITFTLHLHYIYITFTLHCIALHCITLRYSTVHDITLRTLHTLHTLYTYIAYVYIYIYLIINTMSYGIALIIPRVTRQINAAWVGRSVSQLLCGCLLLWSQPSYVEPEMDRNSLRFSLVFYKIKSWCGSAMWIRWKDVTWCTKKFPWIESEIELTW